MTRSAACRSLRGEEGISLPEVIVYIAISVVVLAGLTGLFTAGLSAHADTEARDTATGTIGVAVNSLQANVRNSSKIQVNGTSLRARVAIGNAAAWECRAWSLAGGTLFYKAAGGPITLPATFADYAAEGWTDLTNGVGGVSGTLTNASVSDLPFVQSGTRLLFGLEVLAGDAGTGVALEGSVAPHAAGVGSPTECW